jgi:hypothetical protein
MMEVMERHMATQIKDPCQKHIPAGSLPSFTRMLAYMRLGWRSWKRRKRLVSMLLEVVWLKKM